MNDFSLLFVGKDLRGKPLRMMMFFSFSIPFFFCHSCNNIYIS